MEDGRRRAGSNLNFKYSTKSIEDGSLPKKFDEKINFTDNDDVTHGDRFQEGLERSCVEELKRILPPRGKKKMNYWCNDELSDLRRITLKLRRKAQRAVVAGDDNAGLVSEFKEARKRLRRAIVRSKEEKWREFCATLEQELWGRPHRVVRTKMTRSKPLESLSRGRVARILDDLFVTEQEGQLEEGHMGRSHPMDAGRESL